MQEARVFKDRAYKRSLKSLLEQATKDREFLGEVAQPRGRMIQNINIASLITHGWLGALRTLDSVARVPGDKQDTDVFVCTETLEDGPPLCPANHKPKACVSLQLNAHSSGPLC